MGYNRQTIFSADCR